MILQFKKCERQTDNIITFDCLPELTCHSCQNFYVKVTEPSKRNKKWLPSQILSRLRVDKL